MDKTKQHWKILQKLETDLANKIREFMVIGDDGEGLLATTDDGQGFWFGTMKFGWGETKTANKPTSLNVPELVQMAHGYDYILLLNESGQIYAMGQNDDGQLGLGTVDRNTRFLPQLISSPHKFTSVRCGFGHSLALTEDGKVCAWGENKCGQVGVPSSTESIPYLHQILKLDSHRIVAVECGDCCSLALTDQGEVYGWGRNDWGQLGDGSRLSTHIPIRILTPSPVQSMAAGCYHTLLLTQTGEVYSCGDNGHGQLGLPTTTQSSLRLSKVAGLPFITQIASHHATNLSIAMSSDQRCFVWGELCNQTSISTPQELPPFYSTVESPLSFYSPQCNTPHSISIPETPPNRLSARMSRMFDNPETSPDVQFVVEQRTIHAHRIILSSSSDYFTRMFSERWLAPVNPEDPIFRVTIPDYSYQVFYAFLRFLYTDAFEVQPELLSELFELANQYLESDLQQLCISRMRATLSPTTCCLYYPLTHRHSLLPELATFQQEQVQFASTRMSEISATAAYRAMDEELCKSLTNFVTCLQSLFDSFANKK